MRLKTSLLIILILLVSLTACGKDSKGETNLESASAMMPADTTQFSFTDWASIKEVEGFSDLSSQDSMDRRTKFTSQAFVGSFKVNPPIVARHTAPSSYGLDWFMTHAKMWGWDATDLVWEANFWLPDSAPIFILQFPQDWDFAPLLALFDERGFEQSEYQGVSIYSNEQYLNAEWFRSVTTFAVLNTAVIPQESRLVLCAQAKEVRAVLDVYQGKADSLADDSAAQSVVGRLGAAYAAFVVTGAEACVENELFGERGDQEEIARLRAAMLEEWPEISQVHAYTALGVGYRLEDDQVLGLIVFHYPDDKDAEADLPARQRLAQESTSPQTRQAYSKAVFILDEASVQGSDLMFEVSPVSGASRCLFDMVMRRDMLFAVCPQ